MRALMIFLKKRRIIGRTRVGCFRQVLRSGYNPAEAWMLRMTLVSHGKIDEVLALVK